MGRRARREGRGGPNDFRDPFIDPQGYKRYVDERERTFRAELQKQETAAAR
jgi:hypothetical protein